MRKETAVIAIVVAVAAGFFAGTFTRSPQEAVPAAAPPERGATAPPRAVAAVEGTGVDRPARAKTRAPEGRESPDAVYRVPVARDEPRRGADDALVTVVEWTDFQCPFCSRVQATLRQLEERYGDRVRLVVRMNPLPFHDQAMPAAEAAMAAHAQGQFWGMHDALFESQATLGRETYERIAQQLGLDMRRFRRDLDEHTHREAIEAQQRAGAALGARGTPTFFVNGKKLRGAQPLERFQAAIDAALATAQTAMREHHLRSAQVYDFLIREGATAPVVLGATPGDGPARALAGGASALPRAGLLPRAGRPLEVTP